MSNVAVARRADVTAVVASLAAITGIAWVFTVRLAAGMSMPAGAMETSPVMPSPGGHALVVTAMWAAMMVGMMVPSATPMVLAYSVWTRRGPAVGNRPAAVASFVSGYVIVWLGFSLLAAVLQLTLERLGSLTTMGATGATVGGLVLVLAGLFQLTPAKEACLGRCRTPVGFLIAEWRDGARGGLVMGVRHGAYCLGCCWALMAVLFVVGTMHLTWMAVIAVFVLAEKLAPAVLRVRYAAAAALIGWGALTLSTVGA
jgi:predicted metal-binding membrane protein